MIENRPLGTFFSHAVLIIGIVIVVFPIWITIVAASHDAVRILQVPLPLGLGDQFADNLRAVVGQGVGGLDTPPVGLMLWNSSITKTNP